MNVLVKYKRLRDAGHPLLDDYYEELSQVVEVENPMELNGMFKLITDIKIL